MEDLEPMNIRSLLYFKFNSSFLRNILSLWFREGHFYKVPFGAIKGKKLYYRKDINFHSTMGVWEKDSLQALNKLFKRFGLDKQDTVIADVGANIGYYSLFFSKYLSASARIFAFEPSSTILPILRKNLEANKVSNVTVLELACSDHTGNEVFFLGEHHHESSILGDWSTNATAGTKVTVQAVTLDYYFENFNQGQYPDLIKMDIEGGGIYALKGCVNCITQKRPFILIESHNQGEDQAVSQVLMQYNYEAYRTTNDQWVINKNTQHPDMDGVWGTMLLMPAERKPGFIANPS